MAEIVFTAAERRRGVAAATGCISIVGLMTGLVWPLLSLRLDAQGVDSRLIGLNSAIHALAIVVGSLAGAAPGRPPRPDQHPLCLHRHGDRDAPAASPVSQRLRLVSDPLRPRRRDLHHLHCRRDLDHPCRPAGDARPHHRHLRIRLVGLLRRRPARHRHHRHRRLDALPGRRRHRAAGGPAAAAGARRRAEPGACRPDRCAPPVPRRPGDVAGGRPAGRLRFGERFLPAALWPAQRAGGAGGRDRAHHRAGRGDPGADPHRLARRPREPPAAADRHPHRGGPHGVGLSIRDWIGLAAVADGAALWLHHRQPVGGEPHPRRRALSRARCRCREHGARRALWPRRLCRPAR